MLAKKIACVVALGICVALLAGCSTEICYKGSYYSCFGGTPLKARTNGGGVSLSCVGFSGDTVHNISVGSTFVPLDYAGMATTNVNWPPNVYKVQALLKKPSLCSDPAVLTIVGPEETYKGVFAGGLVQTDKFLYGELCRTAPCLRDITFGLQHPGPGVTPAENYGPVSPAFLLLDNCYPYDSIGVTSIDFTVALLDAKDPCQGFTAQGPCYVCIGGGTPCVKEFCATVTRQTGNMYMLMVVVRNPQDKTVFYILGPKTSMGLPLTIKNGGADIRVPGVI